MEFLAAGRCLHSAGFGQLRRFLRRNFGKKDLDPMRHFIAGLELAGLIGLVIRPPDSQTGRLAFGGMGNMLTCAPRPMLATYSPAGFEQFFERAGMVAEPGASRRTVTAEQDLPEQDLPERDLQRAIAAAPKLNLDIRLPGP